jgi:hypothetical protein
MTYNTQLRSASQKNHKMVQEALLSPNRLKPPKYMCYVASTLCKPQITSKLPILSGPAAPGNSSSGEKMSDGRKTIQT